jgi:hypothetical protein
MIGLIAMLQRKANLYQRRSEACSIFSTAFKVYHLSVFPSDLADESVDASDFLRKYPWPGRAIADTFDDSTHRQGNVSKRFLGAMKIICGKTGDAEDMYDDADYEDERVLYDATEASEVQRPFYWSQQLQESFREELEKSVLFESTPS